MGPALAGGGMVPLVPFALGRGRVGVTGVAGGEANVPRLDVDAAGEGGAEPSLVVGKRSG